MFEIIRPMLDTFCNRYELIPAYRKKESFGDMDILYTGNTSVESVRELFSTGDAFRNGDVLSLVYRDFQIDLIYAPYEEFDYSLQYFGLNDVKGNLVGKLVHKFGLKHGHDGLKLPVRLSSDNLLGEIVLTRDPKVTAEFIDVPLLGVTDTLEEAFECIIRSKYFSKEMFSFENMNSAARIRDKKRQTYHAFLEYIKDRDLPTYPFEGDKNKYLPMIFERFPEAEVEYDALMREHDRIEAARKKFNGDMVREISGLDGKELGQLMKELRKELTVEVVLNSNPEQIREKINEYVSRNR